MYRTSNYLLPSTEPAYNRLASDSESSAASF
jgi:hypothetical protein